jgi:hypothetical protein
MTSRAVVILHNQNDRDKCARWAQSVPYGTRIEWKSPRRSTSQNAKMWALLEDIASQKEHCGMKYPKEVWKVLMMHGLGRETAFVPSLDGDEIIPLGYSSSDLSKGEMSELIEFMHAWGAQNGVVFHDGNDSTMAHAEPLDPRALEHAGEMA